MKFSSLEEIKGFKSFYLLVKANNNSIFELEMPLGDIIQVKYDMDFEDDSSSTADEINEDNMDYFQTISFEVTKVVDNVTKEYKQGNIVLINHRNMPVSYKII